MNFKRYVHTGNERLFLLNKIREVRSDAAVVMITAYGDIDLAVRSLKEGAADFMMKPWHNEKLIDTISEALNKKSGKIKPKLSSDFLNQQPLLGESEVMKDIFY